MNVLYKIKKIMITNAKRLFVFTVIFIFFILGGHIAINIGNKQLTLEEYKIILSLIVTTLSTSGLSFRASSASEEIKDKNLFYIQGKRLFFAAMLFIISLASKYLSSGNDILILFPIIGVFIRECVFVLFIPAFMGGLAWTIISFISLYNIISKGIGMFGGEK